MRLARMTVAAVTIAIGALLSPASAKELKVGLSAEPSAMDPHYHNLTPNNSLLSHVFERLIENDEKQNLIPSLAESWKAINDTTWEFKLRKGVKWHDGSPFTADDVVFTFKPRRQRAEQPVAIHRCQGQDRHQDRRSHRAHHHGRGLSPDAE